MSTLQDLKIISDTQVDEKTIVVELIEEEKKPKYIGKDNPKSFLISISFVLFLFATPFLIAVGIAVIPTYYDKKRYPSAGKYFQKIFGENNNKFGEKNGYDIFSAIVLITLLILISAIPRAGRNLIRYFFGILIFATAGYLGWLNLFYQCNPQYLYSGYHLLTIWVYLVFFNSSLGAFIAALTSNRQPKVEIGLAVSIALIIAEYIFLRYFSETTNPSGWTIGGVLLSQWCVAYYFVDDMKYMICHRYDFYLVNDWFLGFVHLLTDFTFRYWHNMIIKPKPTPPKTTNLKKVKLNLTKKNVDNQELTEEKAEVEVANEVNARVKVLE